MSFHLLQDAFKRRSFHVSPFLVLGDPTPELSVQLAKAAVGEGAGMLEIGFPYGDPVADGPAIQAADLRALRGGTSTKKAIALLGQIREACPDTPLNLLVYGNLVHARGYDRFCLRPPSIALPSSAIGEAERPRRQERSDTLYHRSRWL